METKKKSLYDVLGCNIGRCCVIKCKDELEWKRLRKEYITASESACIIGIGFKSNVWVWEEKVGIKHAENPESEASLALMNRGSVNEPLSRQQWANETGHEVIDGTLQLITNNAILDKFGRPFLACTLDAVGIDKEDNPYIIELKYCENAFVYRNGLPPKYRCQMIKQMIVTGLHKAVLVARIVWFDNAGTRHVSEHEYWLSDDDPDVKYDMENIIAIETSFWNKNVLDKIRPAKVLPEI